MNNGTVNCTRKACGRLMYRNEGKPAVIGNKLHKLCPVCYKEIDAFLHSNSLGQIIKERKEAASRYAEERFMAMGFPQRLALPA